MSLQAILFSCLLAGCASAKHDKDPVVGIGDGLDPARIKAAVYLAHAAEAQGDAGFVHLGCDSVMFTALYAAAGGQANVLAAEGYPGAWYRDPTHTCYDRGAAASDISEDMLLGIMAWAWQTNQPDVAQRIQDFARSNAFVMGRGDISRTFMRPALYSTLKGILGSGPPQQTTNVDIPILSGFAGHLQVLHGLLDASIFGASDLGISVFRRQAARQPRNAFFQAVYHLYTDGDQTAAGALLADDMMFPVEHLPTEAEYCEDYLYQRDDAPKDWSPCNEGQKPHSGAELLFTLLVAEGRFRHR